MTVATIEEYCADCGTILYSEEDLDSGFCGDCEPCHYCTYCDESFGWRDMYDEGMCHDCRDQRDWCYDCEEWKPYSDFDDGDGGTCNACLAVWFDNHISNTAPGRVSWEDYAVWAEKSREYDFGCGFDCNGKCADARVESYPAWPHTDGRACCQDCARNHGYLVYIAPEALETVKALYDDNTGFWRPGGCTLPAKYRSITCLEYSCSAAERSDQRDNAGISGWRRSRPELVQLS